MTDYFDHQNEQEDAIDSGWLADRETSGEPDPEAFTEEEALDESDLEMSFGEGLLRFADAAAYGNSQYPDQIDFKEAMEAFLEGSPNARETEEG